jgi:hypothetical protein
MNHLPVHPWSGYGSSRCRSDSAQIVRRGLACPSIGDNVESDLLSLVEDTHASAFDCADVHEDILAAIIRLDKAEASLVTEELHGTLGHMISSFQIRVVMRPHVSAAGSFEIWRKVVSPAQNVRWGQVVRPKLDLFIWAFSVGPQGLPGKSL